MLMADSMQIDVAGDDGSPEAVYSRGVAENGAEGYQPDPGRC